MFPSLTAELTLPHLALVTHHHQYSTGICSVEPLANPNQLRLVEGSLLGMEKSHLATVSYPTHLEGSDPSTLNDPYFCLSTWTLCRGCDAGPQLSISLSPPVRESPEAVLEPTTRGQRPLQQGPVLGLPLRCGAEELFLWKALLGSGHESHRGCTLVLGGVQGQCEPEGQGA